MSTNQANPCQHLNRASPRDFAVELEANCQVVPQTTKHRVMSYHSTLHDENDEVVVVAISNRRNVKQGASEHLRTCANQLEEVTKNEKATKHDDNEQQKA